MRRSPGFRALLLGTLPALLGPSGALSQEVALIGMARGDDYSVAPADWRVWVAAYVDGTPGQTRTSEGEIYYYPVRATTGQVKLVFWRTGYRGVGEDLVLNGGSPLRRDIVLRKIQPYSTGTVAQRSANLRRELDEQAALARLGGAEARDVFRWNLHLYEQMYRNTELSGEVRAFASRPEITAMRVDGRYQARYRSSLYQRLAARDSGGASRISTREIIRGIRRPSLGSPIRSALIRMLAQEAPSPELKPAAVSTLRSAALEADPAVAAAAFTALLRIGGPTEVDFVLQSTASPTTSQAVAAVGAIGAARLPEGVNALVRVIQTRDDPHLRIATAQALVAAAPQRAIPLLAQTLSPDEAPQVTLAVLEAFQGAGISPAVSAELGVALRRLVSHPNPEVRTEVASLLETETGPPRE